MLEAFIPILVLITLAVALVGIIVVLSFVAGPKNPTAAKLAPYESGMTPIAGLPVRFPVKFLRVAMLFLIFDIETIAFFPWAVLLRDTLGFGGLVEMATFLLVLGIGYIYVWRKGGFRWEK